MKFSMKTLSAAVILGTSAQLLLSGSALAAADLQITQFKALSKPLQGNCNTVTLTVKNIGNQRSGKTKGAIVTFPQGNAFSQRTTRSIYIAPLRPGKSVTMSVSKIGIQPLGNVTIQATVNAPQNYIENNFNNNLATQNVTVRGACRVGGTRTPPNAGCDLELKFTSPSSNSISANDGTDFTVLAKNNGTAACPKRSVRLYRYSGSSASGYGSAVGGTSGSIRQIPALGVGETEDLDWVVNPGGPGTFTFATKFTSPHNDSVNGNHRPKKTVIAE